MRQHVLACACPGQPRPAQGCRKRASSNRRTILNNSGLIPLPTNTCCTCLGTPTRLPVVAAKRPAPTLGRGSSGSHRPPGLFQARPPAAMTPQHTYLHSQRAPQCAARGLSRCRQPCLLFCLRASAWQGLDCSVSCGCYFWFLFGDGMVLWERASMCIRWAGSLSRLGS